jgi:hypothetical protein
VLVLVAVIGSGMMGQGMMRGYGSQGSPSGMSGWAWGLTMGLGALSIGFVDLQAEKLWLDIVKSIEARAPNEEELA